MQKSTRFYVAVHVAARLAQVRPAGLTSEVLAAEIGTNAAFVRRILAQLNAAGITAGRTGRGGGATLAKAPKRISLLELREAVDPPPLVGRMDGAPPDAVIPAAFSSAIANAESAFEAALAGTSLKAFVKSLPTPDGGKA